jgi:hypothetical protein
MKSEGHLGHNLVSNARASLLASAAARCAAIAVEKMATQVQKVNCVLWFHETKSVTAVQRVWAEASCRPSDYTWHKQSVVCLQRQDLRAPACLWSNCGQRATDVREQPAKSQDVQPGTLLSLRCGKLSGSVCNRSSRDGPKVWPSRFPDLTLLDFFLLSRYTPWRRLGGEEVWLLLILNLGTKWGWVVSIMPRPRFTPGERTPSTHWAGGWVGPRAGLDAGARRKILCLCRGSNPGRPVHSQTLYWLSYPGS